MTTYETADGPALRWFTYVQRTVLPTLVFAVLCSASCAPSDHPTDVGRQERRLSSPFGPTVLDAKMGVFSDGGWALDLDGNGVWQGCTIDRCLGFGSPGDKPVVGIWSATDAVLSIGVYRPGTNEWFLDLNHNGSWDGCGIDKCIAGFQSADPANMPVVGRWDGGSTHKIGIFRNGSWFLDMDGDGVWNAGIDKTAFLGSPGDIPVAGKWTASMTHDTTGVFRAGTYFLDGNGNYSWDFDCNVDLCKSFGAAGDTPVVGEFPFGAFPAVTAVGTFTNGTWHFDLNNNFAFDGCATDGCATGFGGSPQLPIVGQWPALQWSTGGDKDLSSRVPAPYEPSAAVVPPGANSSCPNGAVVLAGQTITTSAGQPTNIIYRADLSCANDPNCYTAVDLNPSMASTDSKNTGDVMTSWTPTNQLIHSRNTLRCVGIDCYVIAVQYQSTDCGLSWKRKGAVDSSSSIALDGQCAFRQATDNVPAVFRPSTGQVFVDKNRNNTLEDADLVNGGTLPGNSFIQPGDKVVAGDWDGKLGTRIGRFRNGQWTLDLDGDFVANCAVDACFTYGQAGDIPVVGRWNSSSPDLKHQIGVFRNGTWILDSNNNHVQDLGDTTFGFGQAGDQPVVGDWRNSGLRGHNTRVGVFRTSTAEWFLDQGAVGWQGCGTDLCVAGRAFGDTSHKAISAIIAQDPNYKDGIGTFVDGNWFIDSNDDRGWSGCGPDQCLTYGQAGDIPLPGQWVSVPGGWDRPVMYSDPFNGMLYVFPRCDSRGGGDKSQLYFSADAGTTWKSVRVPGGQWGSQMTSTNGGKLYLTDINTGSVKIWPATVNVATQSVVVHGAQVVDSNVTSNLLPRSLPNFGVARIGRTGSTDVIAVAVPHVFTFANRPPTEGLRVDRIEIATTATGISSMAKANPSLDIFTDSGAKSMIQPTLIEGPLGSQTNFVYWHELGDSSNLATSSVQVRGAIVRASTGASGWTSTVINVSRDASGAPRSWTSFPFFVADDGSRGSRGTGDYLTAAAFGSPPQFYVHWSETPPSSNWVKHASLIGVLEP